MMGNNMKRRRFGKRYVAVLCMAAVVISASGCGKTKKESKPEPKKAAEVDHGNTNASKSGSGQSDAPYIIGTTDLKGRFNPFTARTEADRQVVALTQAELVSFDREGKAVYNGIDGELREYNGNSYTYYGASDLTVSFDEKMKETTYHIKIRDDLVFSDREVLNVDDVIFTLYALLDQSYNGTSNLKEMPVKGLINYLANSTKAEKYSAKAVRKYIRKNPEKLQKWVEKNIIKKELETGMENCKKYYEEAGYSTGTAYFSSKYKIKKEEDTKDEKKLIRQAEKYYRKYGYKKLAKNAYRRADYFDEAVSRQARILMAKGKGKKVKSISGIVRVNDSELEIKTTGYERKMTEALRIPICPLHYYGDKSKYSYSKKRFGFDRGDISALQANQAMPLGAGAYRYVKLEDGVAYFTSNELYFLGCPKTAYVHVKDMSDILVETRKQIQQKLEEEKKSGQTAEPDEEDALNPSAEVTELTQGTVDCIRGSFRGEELSWISSMNPDEELSGKVVETEFVGDGSYYSVGIHGHNVSVGKNPESEESKALRKALAMVFSAAKNIIGEKEGEAVRVLEYPSGSDSWTVPQPEDDEYQIAYNEDTDGEQIYERDDSVEDKLAGAVAAALGYLRKAGFTVDGGKVTEAPEGAKLSYQMLLPGGKNSVCYPAVEEAVRRLGELGITIELTEGEGEEWLQEKLLSGEQELWLSLRCVEEGELPERYRLTGKRNVYGLSDKEFLDNFLRLQGYLTAKERESAYLLCYQKILEQAVEVPICEYRSAVLFSAERMVRSTIPKDISNHYSFFEEIQKIQMK